MHRRKGFSVFTPMVGTIIILITFLIVASMLESEKWNFQGITESYQTIEMSGIGQEVQDRFMATIRDTILSNLENNVFIVISQCRNDQVLDAFRAEYQTTNGGEPYTTCEEKAVNLTQNQAFITVQNLGLSSSYLQAMIKSITNKYSLIRLKTNLCSGCKEDGRDRICKVFMSLPDGRTVAITERFRNDDPNDMICEYNGKTSQPGGSLTTGSYSIKCPTKACIDPTSAIVDSRVIGCDLGGYDSKYQYTKFEDLDDMCPDGRVQVIADFSKLPDTPVAVITSNASQYTELDVYLPKEEKSFTTNDPLAFYALVFAKLFQNFTILDPFWHDVGGMTEHDNFGAIMSSVTWGRNNGRFGNGSYWFHYKYAIQLREPETQDLKIGNLTKGLKFGDFHHIGNVSKTLLASIDNEPIDMFKENTWGMNVENPIYDLSCSGKCNNELKAPSGIISCPPWSWDCFWEYFDIGIAMFGSQTVSKGIPWPIWYQFFELTSGTGDVNTPFPGGYIGTLGGNDNAFSYISGLLDSIKNIDYFTAVNTTLEYDRKFFSFDNTGKIKEQNSPLAEATAAIINHLSNNDTLKVSAGYSTSDKVGINVTVDSKQYYLCFNRTGGNNWVCGQWMAEYVPYIAGYTDSESNLKDVINNNNPNWWFLSLPMNFTCHTCVLYAVEEDYILTRNTHDSPDKINYTVATFRFIRNKENYEDPFGDNSLTLPESGVNSTWRVPMDGHNIAERNVVYWCKGFSSSGDTLPSNLDCGMEVKKDEVSKYINDNFVFL